MEQSLQSERYGHTIMTGLLCGELLIHQGQWWLDLSKLLIFVEVLNRRACQSVILSPLCHNKKWSKHGKEIIFGVFSIYFERSYKVMSIIWKASCALHSSLPVLDKFLTQMEARLNVVYWRSELYLLVLISSATQNMYMRTLISARWQQKEQKEEASLSFICFSDLNANGWLQSITSEKNISVEHTSLPSTELKT